MSRPDLENDVQLALRHQPNETGELHKLLIRAVLPRAERKPRCAHPGSPDASDHNSRSPKHRPDSYHPFFDPEWAECPIDSVNPEDLVAELRRLVLDRELRGQPGARGPAYVRKCHSLESVGVRMDEIYRALWWPKGRELELGERQLS